MADVTMGLAELKQLENTIEQLKEEKQELIDKQMEVLVTTNTHKDFITVKDYHEFRRVVLDHSYSGSTSNRGFKLYIDRLLSDGVLANEKTSNTTKSYKGLDLVKKDIKNEAYIEFKDSIETKQKKINELEIKIEFLSKDYEKEIIKVNKLTNETIQDKNEEILELVKTHDKVLLQVKESFKEKYDKLINDSEEAYSTLKEKFEVFKENKKQITLEEKITELEEQLKEANKPWYKKIF